MSQTPGAPQPTTASHIPSNWAETLQQAHAIDGLPLLPLYGKRPRCGYGWETQGHSVAAVLGWQGITGVGLRTGSVLPGGEGLICFDFDGAGAQIRALELGCDPHAAQTWKIRRIDANGQPVTDRFKLVFRTTAEQAQWFVDNGSPEKSGERCGAQWQIHSPEGDDLEVFHHTGRQIAILGVYPRKGTAIYIAKTKTEIPIVPDGAYYWADGEGFDALAYLPPDWLALAHTARREHNSRDSSEHNAMARATGGKKSRGADWWRIGNSERDACPICGRDSGGGCREHIDGKSIWCLQGATFSPVMRHGILKPGQQIEADDQRTWAFAKELDFGSFGRSHSLFVVHDPDRIRPDHTLLQQPQPWQPEPVPTTDWLNALPGASNGNGNGHSATGVTIEVQATQTGTSTIEAAAGTSAADAELAVVQMIERLGADLQRLDKTRANLIEPELAPRWAALKDAAASLQVRRGSPSALVKDAAVEQLGFGRREWDQELKPLVDARKADLARQRQITRQAELAEAQAQLAPLPGDELPAGETFRHALAMLPPGPGPEITPKRREVMNAFAHLADTRTNALRLNIITKAIEVLPPGAFTPIVLPDAQVQDFYLPMASIGWEVSKELASDTLTHFARRNSYNPVQEYLQVVANDHTLPDFDLHTAASRLLGVHDPLSAVLLRKTLIQAVARAMCPGARAEAVCVLQGPQAALKSSFWRDLMPNPRWHIDTIPEDAKDFSLQQHNCWVFELGEIDHLLRAYDAAHLKRLITSRFDLVRPPYGRVAVESYRPSVMVGTCNPTDFFRDDENRRFWVIQVPTNTSVDLAAVVTYRDAIWRAAFQAWQQGGDYCWWLTPDEADALRERNTGFNAEGQFDQTLATWVAGRPKTAGVCFTTTAALVCSGCVDSVQRAGRRERLEAVATLKRLGWITSRPRIGPDGAQLTVWHRPNETPVRLEPEQLPQPPRPW